MGFCRSIFRTIEFGLLRGKFQEHAANVGVYAFVFEGLLFLLDLYVYCSQRCRLI